MPSASAHPPPPLHSLRNVRSFVEHADDDGRRRAVANPVSPLLEPSAIGMGKFWIGSRGGQSNCGVGNDLLPRGFERRSQGARCRRALMLIVVLTKCSNLTPRLRREGDQPRRTARFRDFAARLTSSRSMLSRSLAHDLLAEHDLTGGKLRLALGKGLNPASRDLGLMLGPVHIVRIGGHGPRFQSYPAIAH